MAALGAGDEDCGGDNRGDKAMVEKDWGGDDRGEEARGGRGILETSRPPASSTLTSNSKYSTLSYLHFLELARHINNLYLLHMVYCILYISKNVV